MVQHLALFPFWTQDRLYHGSSTLFVTYTTHLRGRQAIPYYGSKGALTEYFLRLVGQDLRQAILECKKGSSGQMVNVAKTQTRYHKQNVTGVSNNWHLMVSETARTEFRQLTYWTAEHVLFKADHFCLRQKQHHFRQFGKLGINWV